MKDNQAKGRRGEQLAKQYLQAHGYQVLASRYRTQFGEVDLIARDKQTLVFAEVKARTGSRYGTPAEAVTRQKQKHLTLAAMAYLQEQDWTECPCRFDVIEVFLQDGHICHIQGAFEACM